MERPLILVTNDDGITAPGIRALISVMNEIGEVYVVAPDSPQSGMGHAITLDSTLKCNPVTIDGGTQKEMSCSGTPADCVKIAIDKILPRHPDICVSGINHGSNASINVIYSGTMSAAVEAGLEGIPAVGFSLLDPSWTADFETAKPYIKKIVEQVLQNGLPHGVVLNVNIPATKDIKGIQPVRQCKGRWEEEYIERQDPRGRNYYWLTGTFVNMDESTDNDEYALSQNYISLVPIQCDLTAYKALESIKNWKF